MWGAPRYNTYIHTIQCNTIHIFIVCSVTCNTSGLDAFGTLIYGLPTEYVYAPTRTEDSKFFFFFFFFLVGWFVTLINRFPLAHCDITSSEHLPRDIQFFLKKGGGGGRRGGEDKKRTNHLPVWVAMLHWAWEKGCGFLHTYNT